jgi:hypothetical protein
MKEKLRDAAQNDVEELRRLLARMPPLLRHAPLFSDN